MRPNPGPSDLFLPKKGLGAEVLTKGAQDPLGFFGAKTAGTRLYGPEFSDP